MIRPRTARLAVALTLLLGVAACGDDDPTPAGESGTTSTSSTTGAEATEPTGAEEPADGTTDSEEPTTEPPAAGHVADALVTLDDLGEGWAESEDSDEEESVFASFEDDDTCDGQPAPEVPAPLGEAQVLYEDASELEVISGAAEFAAGEAAEWMSVVLAQMELCTEQPVEEGQSFAVEPISGLGDEAFGVTTAVVVEGEPRFAVGITAARVGDRIVLVGSQTDASDDVDEEALLRKVTARL